MILSIHNLFLIIYLIIICKDIWYNSYNTWSLKYEKNEFYTIIDLLYIDVCHITRNSFILFIPISLFLSLLFLIQFFFGLILFLLNIIYYKYTKKYIFINKKNLIIKILIIIPNSYCIIILKFYKKKTLSKEIIKTWLINWFFITCHIKSRRNINNTLIIIKYVLRVPDHPLWKSNKFRCINDILTVMVENEFLTNHRKLWKI